MLPRTAARFKRFAGMEIAYCFSGIETQTHESKQMTVANILASANKSLFLQKDTPATLTADEQKQESFAAVLAVKTADEAVAKQAKAEKIAAHNAAVLAMVDAVPDAKQEFKDFMEMTPEERMRAQILYSMGLTEEDVAAMSPEEQEAVEAKIAAIIDEKLRQSMEEEIAKGEESTTV